LVVSELDQWLAKFAATLHQTQQLINVVGGIIIV